MYNIIKLVTFCRFKKCLIINFLPCRSPALKTKALWTRAVKRLSSERRKGKDFAVLAIAMMNSNQIVDDINKQNSNIVKQDSTELSLNTQSNHSSMKNGKLEEKIDFFDGYNGVGDYFREDNPSEAAKEGKFFCSCLSSFLKKRNTLSQAVRMSHMA